MEILVVGSVALDSVKTAFGEREELLGGSAIYFSLAASFFTSVKVVGVIGEDFPEEHITFLKKRHLDLEGLEKAKGKTFRWRGSYTCDINQAQTLDTQLNVFESFSPRLPARYQEGSCYLFLANIDPQLQMSVLQQLKKKPGLVVCDTMNFWIERKLPALKETLKEVDFLLINEAEAKQLAGETNLVKAARKILSFGPEKVIVKRGEYGVSMFSDGSIFSLPAFALEEVFDPTGAGDSFAGGFLGFLAQKEDLSEQRIKEALAYGTVIASFNIEDFSVERLKKLTREEIEERFQQFKESVRF